MTLEAMNMNTPDEKHSFEHGDLKVANLPGATIALATFGPGWRWSAEMKPLAGTESCQQAHAGYVVAGHLRVQMDDGTELDLGPGDAHVVSPGHDAWVVGDEPCVIVDVAPNDTMFTGRLAACPCGVQFRVDDEAAIDHLVEAVQQHAKGSHDHELTREHILTELNLA